MADKVIAVSAGKEITEAEFAQFVARIPQQQQEYIKTPEGRQQALTQYANYFLFEAYGKDKGYDIKKASVFCTPSIAMEYVHLDEIKAFDTDLIEMETSSFYLMTELFEIPGIALLVVSDNSASGAPLVGRSDKQQEKYDYGRNVVLPDMILTLAGK